MPQQSISKPPSPWVTRYADSVRAGGSVLDLACGRGRHAVYFASLAHPVTAVDKNTAAISEISNPGKIEIIETDLEQGAWPLPGRYFDAIVVSNYLYRPHFGHLIESLTSGGVLLFDTFAVGNERFGRPRNPDYLLRPGELLLEFGDTLHVIAYEHGEIRESGAAVRQRLCAVRR
jgi:SAM-dependent methyltransferase